jgi:prephenate dehydratase
VSDRRELAYLGPAGTFAEAALRTVATEGIAAIPYPTVAAALEAVRGGDVGGAVVPLENSVEGSVSATVDSLAVGEPLMVTSEIVLPVRFALMVRPGMTLNQVTALATHPHAEAQCRRWIAETLPGVRMIPASSTAAAAAALTGGGSIDTAAPYDAAIAAGVAAQRYGLSVIADGIGDNPQAVTRFVVVTRPAPPPPPTGADKTSLVLFMHRDHTGALLEILTEFAVRGVNLTRIESRPTGEALGRYCFSVDCEGHVAEDRLGEALAGLRRICADVRFLGSYPRVDGISPQVRRGTADDDFRAAQGWLANIREGSDGSDR